MTEDVAPMSPKRETKGVKKEILSKRIKKNANKKTKKRVRMTNPAKEIFSTPNGKSGSYQAGPRAYDAVPISDYKDEVEADGTRRSKRAKFPPLNFWKNERLIYEAQNEPGYLGEAMGDMPVVGGVLKALPTPYKQRKAPPNGDEKKKKKAGAKGGRSKGSREDGEEAREPPFDESKVRRKFDFNDGERLLTWDEENEEPLDRSE